MPGKNLDQFIPLVEAIAGTFGKNCEVVLHDLSKPHQSVIKIANGHVTGRDVGSPATDLVLSYIEKQSIPPDALIGYLTKTKDNKELKSTTIFIKNKRGKIIGALCINIDITPYSSAKSVIEDLCAATALRIGDEEKGSPEKFESSVDNLFNELIGQAIKDIGKPVALMEKKDKLQMIEYLKDRGIFLIKGSAGRTSKELNVSLPTIYKYLEEI